MVRFNSSSQIMMMTFTALMLLLITNVFSYWHSLLSICCSTYLELYLQYAEPGYSFDSLQINGYQEHLSDTGQNTGQTSGTNCDVHVNGTNPLTVFSHTYTYYIIRYIITI